jgi:hypothetical protein
LVVLLRYLGIAVGLLTLARFVRMAT